MVDGARALVARARQRPVLVVAWVATCSLTFLTTLGPVYSVRLEMGPLAHDFVDDVAIQVFFGAFYAGLLAGLARFGPLPSLRRSLKLPLIAFCVVVLASTLWSTDQAGTFTQAVLLCLTAAAGLAVGRATSVSSQITAVFASQQLGALLSLIAVLRDGPGSTDADGRWTGIYIHRNSLGPVAALGLFGAVACASLLWARRRTWPVSALAAAVVGLGLAVAMDVALIDGSGALTSLLGLAVATLGVGAVLVLRRFGSGSSRAAARQAVATLVGLAGVGAALVIFRGTVFPWFGRDRTLDGRTVLWRYLWDFVSERPIRGWGWLGVWKVVNSGLALGLNEAHNGFLEVLLGAGVIGLALIVAFSAVLLWQAAGAAAARGGEALWPFALVLYALVVNQLESYLGSNLLPWVLLVMAAATVSRTRLRGDCARASGVASTPARAPDPSCS